MSTSEAPAVTQATIRKLVADSVTAALEAQAANMANTDNTTRPREAPVARKRSSCGKPTENKGPPLEVISYYQDSYCQGFREKGHYCKSVPTNHHPTTMHRKTYMLRDRNSHQDPNVVTE
ncbi:hypothetical protein Tco_0390190 [Tanacetum coccineum]